MNKWLDTNRNYKKNNAIDERESRQLDKWGLEAEVAFHVSWVDQLAQILTKE